MNAFRSRFGPAVILAGILIVSGASIARAHPMVENGLDVVIRPDRITIDARISPEEILLQAGWPATQPATGAVADWIKSHASYVRDHLKVRADGQVVAATFVEAVNPHAMDASAGAASGASMVPYRLEYPLSHPPGMVQIDQNFLREFNAWSASFVLRIRQVDDAAFDTALLTRERTAEFDCAWPATTTRAVSADESGAARSKEANIPALDRDSSSIQVRDRISRHRVLTFALAILFVVIVLLVFWRAFSSRT